MKQYLQNITKLENKDIIYQVEYEALEIDFELKPGTLFTNGTDIYTAKEIKDGC